MRNVSAYLKIGSDTVNIFCQLTETGEIKDRLIEIIEGEMADK